MPDPYSPVVVQPSSGGDLVTQYFSDDVGPSNYTVKRDWRRAQDAEIRREGDVPFAVNSVITGPTTTDPITLVFSARKANGKTALIVGTSGTLWRYYGLENGATYISGVYDAGVYADASTDWLVIGKDFGQFAPYAGVTVVQHRWEAINVAGKTIFNNGYDLPVVYDLDWLHVKPLYELREQGVAMSETIAEYNGMLTVMDVSNMTQTYLNTTLNGTDSINSGGVTAAQSGATIIANIPFFNPSMAGQIITFVSGFSCKIVTYVSSTVVVVDTAQTVSTPELFNVSTLFQPTPDTSQISRVRYQMLNSAVGDPQAWGSVFTGTVVSNYGKIMLDSPAYSLTIGDSVILTGVGVAGSAVIANVIGFDYGYHRWIIVDNADQIIAGVISGSTITASQTLNTITATSAIFDPVQIGQLITFNSGETGTIITYNSPISVGVDTSQTVTSSQFKIGGSTTVQKSSYPGAAIGSNDLEDDGSAILRAIDLQGRLVVLKETSIFLGTFTGDSTNPISFQRIYVGPDCIFWRWMLTKVDGTKIIYATMKDFFTFDLYTLVPQKHQKLKLCSNLFYESGRTENDMDSCFAATNELTRETWFIYPSSSSDHGIAYDYEYDTCSTLGVAYSAGATIEAPIAGITSDAIKSFVVGTAGGSLRTYGFDIFTGGMWQRNGSNYDSTLKGGYISFGDEFNEKDLRSYIVYASKPAPFTVTLYGARNAQEAGTTLCTQTIASPTYENLISTFFRKNYFQAQIVVTGSSSDCRINRQLFEPAKVESRSTIRRQT